MSRLGRLLHSQRLSAALVIGLIILGCVVLFSVAGPLFVDVDLALVGAVQPSQSPSSEFPLGTDSQGRDMLAVMVVATPQTLKMGVIAETEA